MTLISVEDVSRYQGTSTHGNSRQDSETAASPVLERYLQARAHRWSGHRALTMTGQLALGPQVRVHGRIVSRALPHRSSLPRDHLAGETKAVEPRPPEEGLNTFVLLSTDTSIIAGVCVAESARKTTRPSAAATLPMAWPVAHSSVAVVVRAGADVPGPRPASTG